MDPSAIQLIILVILLILSAFFSSAETALTTVNKHKIRSLAESGNKRARRVLSLIENPSKLLSTILIGNNIVNLTSSSLATILATKFLGSMGAGIATGVLTLLILIFGEITPKTLATMYNEQISIFYSSIIYFLTVIMTPLVFIVNAFSRFIMVILRIDPKKATQAMTESELRTIVNVSHEDGVIETEEKQMITNVVDFGDSLAKDVMIPRINMVFAPVDSTFEELLNIYLEEKYTRLPVYEDNKDNVIGILNIKDLFFYVETKKDDIFDIRSILRNTYFTHEFQKTSALLTEMRKQSQSIAIVLDEYGATAGLITLEDLIEEIVGDIRDEYDEGEKETIKKIKDNVYEIDGSIKLDDLNDKIHISLSSEDYDSIGGYMIEILDHIPVENEIAEAKNLTLKAIEMDKNRIERVLLTINTSAS